jgi:glycosyltransferase involved in cell wall biosynthesis
MKADFFKRNIYDDFVVIDSQFPQKSPFAFRNAEINEYIKRIRNFSVYSMSPMLPEANAPFKHGYGVTYIEFLKNRHGYLSYYPENASKIHYLNSYKRYHFKLAYSFFLAETYTLLPFFKKHHIPFVFVLYPGGLFGLHAQASDEMLRKVFQSPCFRGVLVTQQITKDYLLDQKLCLAVQIHLIYGGFVQFKADEVRAKNRYLIDKQTFDICFVAAKYSEKGVDKGYDLFIEAARRLCKVADNIMFHVVGGFNETDINISDIKQRITFYGYRRPDFLLEFYAGMDIFLSPNRPNMLFDGNFDGFPLGIDAGYCGVAMFVADELHMNQNYRDNQEIVIIPLDVQKIVDKIADYYTNSDSLYDLSQKGQQKTQALFDIDHQINERIKFFKSFTDLKPTLHESKRI